MLSRTAKVTIGRFSAECFSFRWLFTPLADELVNAGVNQSVVRSDGIFTNLDVFARHTKRNE